MQKNNIELLQKIFPTLIFYSVKEEFILKVSPNHLLAILTFLQKHSLFSYKQLICISVIDHPKRKFRFEIVYNLLSISFNKRLYISVSVFEGKIVNSVSHLFFSAG